MSAVMEERTTRGLREVGLLGCVALALYLLIALITFSYEDSGWTHSGTGNEIENACGVFGAWISDFALSIFGLTAFLFPVMLLWHGYLYFFQERIRLARWIIGLRWFGFAVTLMSGASLLYLHLPRTKIDLPGTSGGIIGQEVGEALVIVFGNSGATLLLLAVLLAGVTLFSGLSWLTLIDIVGKYTLIFLRYLYSWIAALVYQRNKIPVQQRQQKILKPATPAQTIPAKKKLKIEPVINYFEVSNREEKERQLEIFPETECALPPLSLLDKHHNSAIGYTQTELEELSRLVEEILQDFGVSVEVVGVCPGPVITRFELQLAAGVKVSRISGLSKDLARAMSVTSVRIVEVIPGKSVIGLEIPNQQREMVSLREVLSSENYEKSPSPLTLVLGKDIAGTPVVANLAKMPHLLVAGTTGSGKSVAINTMILSMLYKSTPDQVRMIMVDPKMLELSVYEGIPHLLTPVVTDMKDAANALRWCVAEMERRYKLMSLLGVRNLAGYNKMINDALQNGEPIKDPMYQPNLVLGEDEGASDLKTLPNIVIVIDELADMMMIVGKKVEELIARLAQKARAAGLHLILATQRPSVDVLTGLIKANVPTRLAFQVSSRIDSRTILDQGGAESLLGNGDMLFLPSGTSIPIRAHGAFVDDHEVHKVVEFLKKTGRADYLDLATEDKGDSSSGFSFGGFEDNETDALYDEAVSFVTETRKASISSVQRRFKIGYNRAARMIEDMEAAGVVSSPESNGSREVLAPAPPRD